MDLSISDLVSLKEKLSYLKTADPMPMLRPPDLVAVEEVGEVVGIESFNQIKVRFRCGVFLIHKDKLIRRNLDISH
tara:strand:+ start:656 stop:883 length:228 start_codon:yes stop_codon:yes gene_type:complete